MRAFEVLINGKKLCLAGVGVDGAFAAIISHVIGSGRNLIHIRVGGIRGIADGPDERVEWGSRNLRTGDEITLRIVKAHSVDRPRRRKPVDLAATRKSNESLCRKLAKMLGWTIVASPRRKSIHQKPSTKT